MLRDWLVKALPVTQVQKRLEAFRMRQYLGPLFEFPFQEVVCQREANRGLGESRVPQAGLGARKIAVVGAGRS